MRRFYPMLVFLFLTSGYQPLLAQLAPQLFGGHRAAEYNFLWFKEVDKKGKLSLFNYTTFTVNYASKANNAYEIYQVGIFNLNKTWGIAGGGRFISNEFIPLIALSFQQVGKDWYFNLFPSAQLTTSAEEPFRQKMSYSLFGLLFYKPKLNDTWKMFNQLSFEPLLSAEQHLYSYQQIRVGLQYNERFQFGLGANLEQLGKDFSFRQNYGLFLRKEFN
jgi:hypothetical protein